MDVVADRTQAAPAVPAVLARLPLRAVRPADGAEVYAQPRQQLARLERAGVLHRFANGHYVVVPQDQVGLTWLPPLEAAAAGVAVADTGFECVAVMGISAARLHGVLPRALATAVIAVPRQRKPLVVRDRDAVVEFVRRDVSRLDVESLPTELGRVLVTTPEQTVLDLAHRPTLGDAENEVHAAVRALLTRCDGTVLERLAREQRRGAALRRAQQWAEELGARA
jgi:predicted transcriptional regulator of viral defense system